jgi:hypothetical protein
MVVKRHGRRQQSTGGGFVLLRSRWYLPSLAQCLWKFKLHEELVQLSVYILVQVYAT